jgi:hypothetical protein
MDPAADAGTIVMALSAKAEASAVEASLATRLDMVCVGPALPLYGRLCLISLIIMIPSFHATGPAA